jgi:Acetyltransferase (GNAT) domain
MDDQSSTIGKQSDSAFRYLVRPLRTEEGELWNRFVRQSAQGKLFHTFKWLQSIGRPFQIHGCFEQGTLVGGMVLIEDPPQVAINRYHFGPYHGVVLPAALPKYLTNLKRHRDIMTALANYAKERFKKIDCYLAPEVVDVQPFMWAGYSVRVTYTYRIDLTDLDQVWRNMEDKRRNDIRRAERDGITVDDKVRIEDVLRLTEKTYQRQEGEVHFSELATRIEHALFPQNQCRCFVARAPDGTPLAGIFMVWDEKEAYYFLGGYDSEGHRGAGALAIWHAIRYAGANLGLQRFDFLGSYLIKLERFFRDFGGIWTPRYDVFWERASFLADSRRLLRKARKSMLKSVGNAED